MMPQNIWVIGKQLAREDNRSFSAQLSQLIVNEAKRRNLLAQQQKALAEAQSL